MRLHQLPGIDPEEIIVPFNKDEIDKLWTESVPCKICKEIAVIFGGERLTTNILKAKEFNL